MTRRSWYLEHDTVTLTVPVEGGEHRVLWRRGRLVLCDHDVAAEDVLRALGGEVCPCLAVRDMLRALGAPGTAAGRPGRTMVGRPGSSLSVPVGTTQAGPMPWKTPTELRNRRRALRLELAQVFVQQSLQVIVDAMHRLRDERYLRRTDLPRPVPLSVAEALELRAAPALELAIRQSLPYLSPQAPINVAVWKDTPGEPALLQGDFTSHSGFIAVSLPVHWLTRVAARGLACLDGHFVLDVDAPAPAMRLHGKVVRWEKRLGGHWAPVAAACFIERRGGRWKLTT